MSKVLVNRRMYFDARGTETLEGFADYLERRAALIRKLVKVGAKLSKLPGGYVSLDLTVEEEAMDEFHRTWFNEPRR